MARVYTGRRIISALQIPPAEYAVIYDGVIAVHPKWLTAVRSLVAAQPQMLRWLDRGMLATQDMINWQGEYGWIIHKPGKAGRLSTGYLGREPSPEAGDIQRSNWPPGVTVPELTYVTSDRPFIVYSSIIRTDNGFFPPGSPVKVRMAADWSAQVPIGAQVRFVGNGDPSYPYRGLDEGIYAHANYDDVRWSAPAQIATPVPQPTMVDWPLISGPAVCTRGEIWPRLGAKWFAASYGDVATAIELASVGLQGTNRTKATRQIETLRSRPTSMIYFIMLGEHDNAWALYPPTAADSETYRKKTAVEEDIDFGAINSFLTQSRFNPFVTVVLGDERIVSGVSTVDVFPTEGEIRVELTGNVTWNASPLPVLTSELPSYCAWIRARGSKVTSVTYDGKIGDIAAIVVEANNVLAASSDVNVFLSETADYGGVGLAALTAGMRQLSESKQGMLRSIIQPSYLDWAIEHSLV